MSFFYLNILIYLIRDMSQGQTVLAFDIGIRNLAWCILRKPTDSSGVEVLGWDNYDLLSGQSRSTPTSAVVCAGCSAKATYETKGGVYCVRHCPIDRPAFRDVSGNLVKKLPAAKELRQVLLSRGIPNPPKSKGDLLKRISELYAIPILKQKVKKAVDTELSILHDAIRRFVLERKELFSQVQEILLENQPVLKNPTMKSVQILLFATLRDLLQPSPPKLRLVHAKTKVVGKETGDAGYKARKQGSEERANDVLQTNKVIQSQRWRNHLAGYPKKNDLTDAFCMCVDFLGVQ
jgi:hypothetical protein